MDELHGVSVSGSARKAALKFVLLIGVVSFFADFKYEGCRHQFWPSVEHEHSKSSRRANR